jgi:poly-beta-1,6-N-acetyl-D-glucosamine N-deacetylase
MVDRARPPALTRRRFLTLSAAAATVPVLSGCGAVRTGTVTGQAVAGQAVAGQAVTVQAVTVTTPDGIRPQVDTPLGPDQASVFGAWPGPPAALGPVRGDSLLVLSYHNVTADGLHQGTGRSDRYTVSAADFAAHIDMLRRTGFRSVRLGDVLDARRSGRPLPQRSVLITFDDGGAGQWIYADRVLAAAGFSAATFLITGHLGASPSYLSWPEAQALAGTGRWDIGAHTHDHHHLVSTGPSGPRASVLINRVWDRASSTLQPVDVARAMFEADLNTSLTLLARAGLAKPRAFAYPFSQVDVPTNDAAFAAYVRGRLAGTFPLLVSNTSPGRTARPEDLHAGMLPRVEVRHNMSTLNLFEQIGAADTIRGDGQVPGGLVGG